MKLGFDVPDPVLQEVVASKPGVIEYILNHFKKKVHSYVYSVLHIQCSYILHFMMQKFLKLMH